MAHWRSTPDHAWLILSPTERAKIDPVALRDEYEEDCEWSIAVLALPELSENHRLFPVTKDKTLELARQMARNYYPDIYTALTGEETTPENSRERAREEFERVHANDWTVYSARGDWAEGCPKGYVECLCALGGKWPKGETPRKKVYVPSAEYSKRRDGFPFVLNGTEITIP